MKIFACSQYLPNPEAQLHLENGKSGNGGKKELVEKAAFSTVGVFQLDKLHVFSRKELKEITTGE